MEQLPCVILGKEEPRGAAFAASGCSSILDFLSSLLNSGEKLKRVVLTNFKIDADASDIKGDLVFLEKGVRNREGADSFARFLHALPLLPCEELEVFGVEFLSLDEFSALCSGIGSPHCTLRSLILEDDSTRQIRSASEGAQTLIKDALCNNTSITSLFLNSFSEWIWDDCIIPVLTQTPCSIKQLFSNFRIVSSANFRREGLSGLFEGLALNTISLTRLSLTNFSNCKSFIQEGAIGSMLNTNTSLRYLELTSWEISGEVVRMMFASLEQNDHLMELSLASCSGLEWPSASFVLDCLRVNGNLNHLDVSGSPLEGQSTASIEAQLQRNKERVEQLKALKEANSAQVQPTTVRLFLCGLPYSGKTTLSRSLVRWNSTTSKFTGCLSCIRKNVPDRTRGIEISTIKKGKVKVSLWDMAGQAEYYAFHDYMFPNLSNDETPSLFSFVWNPVQISKEIGKEIIVKEPEKLEQELRYWLRFIASKTLLSQKFKPKVLVTITRLDLLDINIITWIKKSLEKCQEDFQEHIELDMKGVFALNARDPSKVEDLALYMFESAELLLDSKPLVYKACNLARSMIPEKASAPLITKQEFSFLCKKHLGLDSDDMREAVALSLNESGDLIYFKSFDLVVVDTQWFCHHLMGNLLYFGRKRGQHNGFFSLEFLEELLEKTENVTMEHGKQVTAIRAFSAKASKSYRIKGEDLVKVLIGLQLACRRHDDGTKSDIFIPTSLYTVPQIPVDPSKYLKGDDANIQTFLGRRLKCKDSKCTFLTPGIFSQLQVAFDNIYKGINITLKEDIIAFSRNGVNVLVEFCKHEGQDHFIDVLIHSCLNLDSTIEWVNEKILDVMKNVCAQPRGNQGVQLVDKVIRPRCIRECVSKEQRRDADVSIEELRHTLSLLLEKNGILDFNHHQSAFHSWYMTNDSDRVIDLLGNVEALKVLKDYQEKFILDAVDVLGIDVKQEACSEGELEKRVFRSTASGNERQWIFEEVRGARQDIREVHKEIHKLTDNLQKLGHAIMPKLEQTVEKLLTFAKDTEVGKFPRLFVVTRHDAGLGRRLVSAMQVPGLQNLRLELLCEHCREPHLVAEQCGINFAILEDGLLKQGLPYINLFLKLASLAVKVAAHVAAGVGGSIPDFRHVLALIVDTDEFPSLPTCLDCEAPGPSRSSSRVDFQESQRWLWKVLEKHKCCTSVRIHEVFGLSRVRYHNSLLWLCDEHSAGGELCPI